MAHRRLSMRKTKEILRLKYELGLSNRQIARSCNVSRRTVAEYICRAEKIGIPWPLPEKTDNARLEEFLFGEKTLFSGAKRTLPDMEYIHREMRRKGVTLRLLWEEYLSENPDGYQITQFCEYYSRWKKKLHPTMRLPHKAGEKMFVDWAGQTIPVINPKTGVISPASIFVAVLGASSYMFIEAFPNQKLPQWIAAHCDAYEYFEGVTKITVPDNPRTAVNKACRYEPDMNATYQEMAEHYGTVIIPARTYKPRDKAKVETAVQNAERSIIAVLRHQTFFSVAEVNRAIKKLLMKLNSKPFQKLAGSRLSLYEELEKLVLLPLPEQRYQFSQWSKATVNIDYHIQAAKHFYSVPYQNIHQQVDVRLTDRTVEIFIRKQRVAAHRRSYMNGRYTTDKTHMPEAHQKHLEWTPDRLISWAQKIGDHCAQAVKAIIESKPHPELGYRACLGIMRLSRDHGSQRVEAACRRALKFDTCSYRSIKSILKTKLDKEPLPGSEEQRPLLVQEHKNVRGEAYYAV
jgi:transposase